MPNVLVMECHLNTGQSNHLITSQMNTILFSYVLVLYLSYLKLWICSTKMRLAKIKVRSYLRPTIWILNHRKFELQIVWYSNVFCIQLVSIQIPTVFNWSAKPGDSLFEYWTPIVCDVQMNPVFWSLDGYCILIVDGHANSGLEIRTVLCKVWPEMLDIKCFGHLTI